MVVLITICQGAACPDNKDGAGVVYIYYGGVYPLIDQGLWNSHLCFSRFYIFTILSMWFMENICDHCTWMTSRVLQRQLKQSVAEACQGNCEVLVPTSRHPWISMITDTSMSVYLEVVDNNEMWKSRHNLSSRDFAVGSPGSGHAVVLRSFVAIYMSCWRCFDWKWWLITSSEFAGLSLWWSTRGRSLLSPPQSMLPPLKIFPWM